MSKKMDSKAKSVWTALGVLAVGGSLVAGALSRDRVETGSASIPVANLEGMVASNSKAIDVGESDFFYQLMQLLEKEYVDPVKEDDKLAVSSVRGMVLSLSDPDSFFMDQDHFKDYLDQQAGKFKGIGAEFELKFTPEQLATIAKKDGHPDPALLIPDLIVSFVAPGGPAALAGIKPGDQVQTIDGRWVLATGPIKAFRDRQKQVTEGKLPAAALNSERAKMRDMLKTSMTPGRARELMSSGTSGPIAITVLRGGKPIESKLIKALTTVPSVQTLPNGSIALRFYSGAAQALAQAIQGKQDVTIDLRDSGDGNYQAMRETLAALAPAGSYGLLTTERNGSSLLFQIEKGASSTPKLTLVVDGSTESNAEIFALALSSKGLAKLEGEKMAGKRKVVEIVSLPGGSGYTLATGVYRPELTEEKKS